MGEKHAVVVVQRHCAGQGARAAQRGPVHGGRHTAKYVHTVARCTGQLQGVALLRALCLAQRPVQEADQRAAPRRDCAVGDAERGPDVDGRRCVQTLRCCSALRRVWRQGQRLLDVLLAQAHRLHAGLHGQRARLGGDGGAPLDRPVGARLQGKRTQRRAAGGRQRAAVALLLVAAALAHAHVAYVVHVAQQACLLGRVLQRHRGLRRLLLGSLPASVRGHRLLWSGRGSDGRKPGG